MGQVFIAHECCTIGPPKETDECDSNSIITMYGNTEQLLCMVAMVIFIT